jgi:hypothetical protein
LQSIKLMCLKIALVFLTLSIESFAYIGGTLSKTGEFPSVLWIEYGCTGSLISADKILIAAHCVLPYKFAYLHQDGQKIRIYNTPNVMGTTPTEALIQKVIIHEDWVKKIEAGYQMEDFISMKDVTDLAVLVLTKPISIPGLMPAKISYAALKKGQKILVGGYGCESKTPSSLEPKYKYASKQIQVLNGNILSVGEKNADKKSNSMGCEGDSGGPAFIIKNKQKIQIGVNSSVQGDATKGQLNLVNLSPFENWLMPILDDSKK